MKFTSVIAFLVSAVIAATPLVHAQSAAPAVVGPAVAPQTGATVFNQGELDALLAPIVFHHDALLSQISMAATCMLENQDLAWTQKLGDAFLGQQAEVLAAVQELRLRAQSTGAVVDNGPTPFNETSCK